MADTGWTFPGTAVSGTPTTGDSSWTNTGNIFANDGNTSSNFIPLNGTSDTLLGRNFGFSVPSNATIDGVQARYERGSSLGSATEVKEQQVHSGAYEGTNQSNSSQWATGGSFELVTYGGSSNLMGFGSITPSIVNSSSYGWGIEAEYSGGANGVVAAVDYVQMRVFFTTPPADPTNCSATQDGADVDVTWTDNATDEDNYEVSVSVNGGSFSVLTSSLPANTTSYTDTSGYSNGDTLDYRVRALKTSGPDSGFCNAAQIEFGDSHVLSPIDLSQGQQLAATTIEVSNVEDLTQAQSLQSVSIDQQQNFSPENILHTQDLAPIIGFDDNEFTSVFDELLKKKTARREYLIVIRPFKLS